MVKFYQGNALNTEIECILQSAEEKILLISPFIKLHDRFSSVLRTKMKNDKIAVVVVFGKNEADVSRSIKIEDINFFKEFANLS